MAVAVVPPLRRLPGHRTGVPAVKQDPLAPMASHDQVYGSGDTRRPTVSPDDTPAEQAKRGQRDTGDTGDTSARRVWTASELLAASFPEPRWAIPGLVPEGLTALV